MINQYADGAFERCLTAIDNDPRGTVERSGPRATASLSLSLCFLISVTFFFTGEVRTTILGLVKILPDTRGHSETRSPSDTGDYFFFYSADEHESSVRKSEQKKVHDRLLSRNAIQNSRYSLDHSERPLCIWINPSITCLTPRHFAQMRAY